MTIMRPSCSSGLQCPTLTSTFSLRRMAEPAILYCPRRIHDLLQARYVGRLREEYLYDAEGVKHVFNKNVKSGHDVVSFSLGLNGEVVAKRHDHAAQGCVPLTEITYNTYDGWGRLRKPSVPTKRQWNVPTPRNTTATIGRFAPFSGRRLPSSTSSTCQGSR